MLDIFENLYKKYDPSDGTIWKYNGLVKYANIVCHKITFESPDFSYTPYKVKEGETLEELSKKLFISDYMVYEINPSIRSFELLEAGTVIKIPSDYGKKIILYVEKDNNIPVGVKIFDDTGLYEEYTYLNVTINPQFSRQDFDINNPEYGFN
jgi:outer membrane lipoprotein-sorting protein